MHGLIKFSIIWVVASLLLITVSNVYATHDGQHVCSDGKLPYWELGGWWCEGEPQDFSNSTVTVELSTGNTNSTTQIEQDHFDEINTGFTGWKQVGDRMEHYRNDVKTISYNINDRTDMIVYKIEDGVNVGYKNGVVYNQEAVDETTTTSTPEEILVDKEILDLRLRILQVIENIFRIIFN